MAAIENKPLSIKMHNYFTTVSWEHDFRDASLETVLDGVCTCLIGLGWERDSILQSMENYAYDRLPKNDNDDQ
jgi:hypothetical protein